MNKITPKALLSSKWTKVEIKNKEKHFLITKLKFDEHQNVTQCIIEAVFSNNEYDIDWRSLKDNQQWRLGWL